MALTPQLEGLEGKRVEVEDMYGQVRRFWVRRNHPSAQIRIHLEVKTIRSLGGFAADPEYRRVTMVRDH
jgi:hypothetical protein